MVKASALYIVIVIALVIAVCCSSLIVSAYFFKTIYQQNFRIDQLQNNAQSGINILIDNDEGYRLETKINLYNSTTDSLIIKQSDWGIYNIGIVKAFVQADTLTKVFSMANSIDSAKWSALYVIDEDRSISVSGKTHIKGPAFIPKAGIREAYVNQEAYQGDKKIINGMTKNSEKQLPALFVNKLQAIEKTLVPLTAQADSFLITDTLKQSFLKATKFFDFKKKVVHLNDVTIKGNVIITSDTTLYVDSTAKLEHIIIKAPEVIVGNGFHGNCQIFASDSIQINKNCVFNYPSCLAIIPEQGNTNVMGTISIGSGSVIKGSIFIYSSNTNNQKKPIVKLETNCIVFGEVYVPGLINIKNNVAIYGSIFANRFIYQTNYTRYENYLINIDIDASKLSSYYLSNKIMPIASQKRKVLQWLN